MVVGEGLAIGAVVATAVKAGAVEGPGAGSLLTLVTPKATPIDMPITSVSDIARTRNFSVILVFIYPLETLKVLFIF